MAQATPSPSFPSFPSLYTHLLTLPPPLLPPAKPTSPSLTPKIAALSLHPTLEAAFHILNNNLPSAHFLVRHMQAAPKFEGMFLHGILHRVEGDYDNARAWYGSVGGGDGGEGSEVFRTVWGDVEGGDGGEGGEGVREGSDGVEGGNAELRRAREFIDQVEAFVKSRKGDRETLERDSLREIKAVVEFCRRKFGEGEYRDASEAWVKTDERINKIKEDMLVGGEGFRQF